MNRIITKVRCPKCGFSCSDSQSIYSHDPIGIPFIKCPKCGEVIYAPMVHREWIQLSPINKIFAISSKSILPFIISFIIAFITSVSLKPLFSSMSGVAYGIVILLTLAVGFILGEYLTACIQIHSDSFKQVCIQSLNRTRNKEYLQLIKGAGKIYSEEIPRFIIGANGVNKHISHFKKNGPPDEVPIPTFQNSIYSR